ncbi:MAG: type II toxin-antitoxin system RelE/ParE family toxin [Lachnospiraceae bacterium]|nr:type II toxin-antitoxin system RelE/ParE family toxin [Lachnospiraceae bacterium]
MHDFELLRGFIESPRFHKRWFFYGLSENDLLRLQLQLLEDPKAGSVIPGTGRLRKLRFAFPDRGKSGSVRVLYIDFEQQERIFLLNVFAKNEQENLTQEQRNNIKKSLLRLEEELFGGKENE